MKKIFKRTVVILFIFYTSISLAGYLSLGNSLKDISLILQRKPLTEDSSDIWMKVGIFFIIFQVLIGYITHVIPLKSQVIGHF